MLRAAGGYWGSQGIEGEILCTGEVLGSYAAPLRDAGYRIHHLPFARSAHFLHSIYRFFRSHRFDTVHIHSERASFWYAGLAYVTGHRRMIRSLHGVFSFRGGLRVRRYLQRLIMRRIFGVRMASPSETVRRVERSTFHNSSVVIANWFDSNQHHPPTPEQRAAARRAFGIEPGAMVICSVGNCLPLKNHTAVLQAIAEVPPSLNILYLHAGEEQHGNGERSLAAGLGIAGRVQFIGPFGNVQTVLHASDLFVMPSLREGFGIAAMEAMGAGVPVVLSDVEGLCDFHAISPAIHWIEPTSAAVKSAILHFHGLALLERKAIGDELSAGAHRSFGVTQGAAQYAALYRGTPV
jgi:glycosyltransferase involved in cell wall biosynthesis